MAWISYWFRIAAASSDWSISTRTIYQRYLRYFAALGPMRLSDLRADDVQAIVAQLLEVGADRPPIHPITGKKTQRVRPITAQQVTAAVGVLRRALDYARDNGIITINPVRTVFTPSVERKRPEIWTRAEMAKLRPILMGDRLETLWVLSLTCGLRIGELLALKWDVFSEHDQTLTICRTRFRNGRVQEWPKSRRSRTIGLSVEALASLLRHRQQQHAGAVWVFEHVYGDGPRMWTYDGVLARLERLCARAGVPYHATHTGRHAHATHLLAIGIPAADVADRLGHADASVTLRLYAHSSLEGRQRAISAADGILQD
jgi:integrase